MKKFKGECANWFEVDSGRINMYLSSKNKVSVACKSCINELEKAIKYFKQEMRK